MIFFYLIILSIILCDFFKFKYFIKNILSQIAFYNQINICIYIYYVFIYLFVKCPNIFNLAKCFDIISRYRMLKRNFAIVQKWIPVLTINAIFFVCVIQMCNESYGNEAILFITK